MDLSFKAFNMHNKIGFTLAEVLITLVIIGVIASLTIPNIVADTQQAEFKAKWQKEYSVLSQITNKLIADQVIPADTAESLMNAFGNYLNYSKKCTGTDYNCWHLRNNWRTLSGLPIDVYFTTTPTYILTDGTLLTWNPYSGTTCTNNGASVTSNECIHLSVDVNGFKSPNRLGYDIFGATIYLKRLKVDGSPSTPSFFNQCNRAGTYYNDWDYGCSARALKGEDY